VLVSTTPGSLVILARPELREARQGVTKTLNRSAFDPGARGSVLGIDIGGTGSRAALEDLDSGERVVLRGATVSVGAAGSSVGEVALGLLAAVAAEHPDRFAHLRGVAVGASGLASLVAEPERFPIALRREAAALGADGPFAAVVAIDAVTAHLGALGGSPGAVVALGTGAIAFGGDGAEVWRRVDGWGHLLGDRGGGAWVGLHGLELAMRAHDGVDRAGRALLEAAESRFGHPAAWPTQLYTREDRAAVLAGFAPDVIAVADTGDGAALSILRSAGAEAARSAIAALGPDLPPSVALTGGLARASTEIRRAFWEEARRLRLDVAQADPLGDPLDGAVLLARRAAAGDLSPRAPFVWA